MAGELQGRAALADPPFEQLISNMESSFLGHTVNALVLTGDEGRDKLR